ncbi:hypothetical protein D0T92_06675 [Neisseria zalophi]|uniref:Uncharacterized protein n=1 Tax=Neisseria zalophi TaxID=640030 RepID=A0A5J6PZE1_9NEIS|nr:hypothetical protein D0T92_06675 [Neisseria zalophi]
MKRSRGSDKGFTLRELNTKEKTILIDIYNIIQVHRDTMVVLLIGKYLQGKEEYNDSLHNKL